MIDRDRLLDDLKSLTGDLVDDLRTRTDEVDAIHDQVHGQYRSARSAGRTDQSFEEWREDLLAQVAVGWVLATVFVRFCEDNDLYDTPLLSGPGDRRELAGDRRADWLAEHPAAGDREWLQEIFERYRQVPVVAELFGEHNPLWQFGPSADGAKAIVELWQRVDEETGELWHDFTDPELDTRFLGDLYQDLSEHAKKTYALLQTPEFVEEFILDYTLDPAIETFGLSETKMIDPACGSGHFLLGAFDRILNRWREREPGTPVRELVQRTLKAVNGVDLNPYAAEIARFRLLVAALRASGIDELADAPAFHINVAVGDSLLHGRRSGELFSGAEGFGDLLEHRYPTEDEELANRLLEPGQYHAAVGNPPYITAKDPAMNDAYRTLYDTCYYQYSLAVPFIERMFDLTVHPNGNIDAGFIGLITANTFMKRRFGIKIVERWLPEKDLTHIIDTSGAYIPGHGTPTVILFGRERAPQTDSIRTVLGIRGEPGRPQVAQDGKVWTSIITLIDEPSSENKYISVHDAPRERFENHPWSLQGGQAPHLLDCMRDSAHNVLSNISSAIGYTGLSSADAIFIAKRGVHERYAVQDNVVRSVVKGEGIRDWKLISELETLFPYDIKEKRLLQLSEITSLIPRLWPHRRILSARKTFGKNTYKEEGRPWWEWHQVSLDRVSGNTIAFARVSTHNNFSFTRTGNVFNQSAPVIKLDADASEPDYLRLLGLLNCSAACFWMKQVFHCKGSTVDSEGARQTTIPFEDFYDFDASKLEQFPIPEGASLELARRLDGLAQQLTETLPAAVVEKAPPAQDRLQTARDEAEQVRARMVALQEELDWECYQLYGLTDEELTAPSDHVPLLNKGERAFEIVLARQIAAGERETTWFKRHDSTPITELPSHWPEAYQRVVEERIELIESDRSIRLLEQPEHKRRWNWDSWEELQEKALEKWLLDRLEAEELWSKPELSTTARLTDQVRKDEDFLEAARLYAGRVDVDLTELVTSLVGGQAVPFAVGYRFNSSGMRRRREWEKVWELQRQEDAIDARTELPQDDPDHLEPDEAEQLKSEQGLDDIPVPPKYRKSDYSDNTAYKLRGNLDVPKERFIRYPDTQRGADTTPVIGWAGWDHLEQAQALASHFSSRKDQGADREELVALLAGLQELVPWLQQWHNDYHRTYGQRMGDFFASFVADEARPLNTTPDDLSTWTP